MPQSIEPRTKFRVTFSNGNPNLRYVPHVIQVSASAGGNRLDSATIRLEGKADEPILQKDEYLKNESIMNLFQEQEVQIYEDTPGGDFLHYGLVSGGNVEIDTDAYIINLTSQVEDHWISKSVEYAPYQKNVGTGFGQLVNSHLPWVLNPYIDGILFGNRWKNSLNTQHRLVHGDSIGIEHEPFTIKTAVEFLLNNLYKAPLTNVAVLNEIDDYQVRHVEFDRGMFLPDCLDRLLRPYGYDWKFEPYLDGVNPVIQLVVWKRSKGFANHVINLDSVHGGDPEDSDAERISVKVGLADRAVTKVRILGDPVRLEGTFELYPAWAPEDEGTDVQSMRPGRDLADFRVFRDYVLNEGWNYSHLNDMRFDAENFFSGYADVNVREMNRRRRFYPTITLGKDGRSYGPSGGYFLERFNGTDWQPMEGFSVLRGECGIRLTGSNLKTYAHTKLRLRITACIESDRRTFGESLQQSGHLIRDKILVVETNGKYRRQERKSGGDYKSVLINQTHLVANEVDDEQTLFQAAEDLMQRYNRASGAGEVRVRDHEFDAPKNIGKRIETIVGREIDLNMSSGAGGQIQGGYPVITGFDLDCQRQVTTYFLDNLQ